MKYLNNIIRIIWFNIWMLSGCGMIYFVINQNITLLIMSSWIHGAGFVSTFNLYWGETK